MPSPVYQSPYDLTALSGTGTGWPASLAEAKKLPAADWKKSVDAALKTKSVKSYLADCNKAADIMDEKIALDTTIDLASAELAIITAFFSSLVNTGVIAKVNESRDEIVQAILKLPTVIKTNWDTVKPYVLGRDGTTLDCARYGWHREGPIEHYEYNPPPEYLLVDGKPQYQPQNAQYYAGLPKMPVGSTAGSWGQFIEWVTYSDEKARTYLKALYGNNGILNAGDATRTAALYPAVAKWLRDNIVPKFAGLLTAWKYGSPQKYMTYKADEATYKIILENATSKRQALATDYAAQMKQLPIALQQVPAGFLRDVAYEAGAALLAGREAQAHADAAQKLAQQAGKTLDGSGKAVQDARQSQFRATGAGSGGGVDFGESEASGSAAARAGAGYAAAHAASKRAGANKRNGKAKTENDAARTLSGIADEKSSGLGTVPFVDLSALKTQTDATDQQITDNAQSVVDQGDKLQEVLSQLTEIDTRSIGDQVEKNTDDASTLLNKGGLPWWVYALAGLAVLRR